MAKYAIIENGIVENIIEADSIFIVENNLDAVEVTALTGVPYIKGTYNNNTFQEPQRICYDDNADLENGIPATSLGN